MRWVLTKRYLTRKMVPITRRANTQSSYPAYPIFHFCFVLVFVFFSGSPNCIFSKTGILTEQKFISDCRYRIIKSSSLVPVLFREVFSRPYISFFRLLENSFCVIQDKPVKCSGAPSECIQCSTEHLVQRKKLFAKTLPEITQGY